MHPPSETARYRPRHRHREGLRGLTVRELAAAAEVNLGSFVYHFGNRDAFIDELVGSGTPPL